METQSSASRSRGLSPRGMQLNTDMVLSRVYSGLVTGVTSQATITHRPVSSATLLLTVEVPWPTTSCESPHCHPNTITLLAQAEAMLRPAVSRSVYLGVTHPPEAHDQIFVALKQLRGCWCGAPSLTRGRVRSLHLLLGFTSAVFLGSKSRSTEDRILLSQIWNTPNLKGQVPVFIYAGNRVAQLYPPPPMPWVCLIHLHVIT
jgi:hypothetical protein